MVELLFKQVLHPLSMQLIWTFLVKSINETLGQSVQTNEIPSIEQQGPNK